MAWLNMSDERWQSFFLTKLLKEPILTSRNIFLLVTANHIRKHAWMLQSNLVHSFHRLTSTFHANSNWWLGMHCLQEDINFTKGTTIDKEKKLNQDKSHIEIECWQLTCVWVAIPLIWALLPCKLAICCLSLISCLASILVAACRIQRKRLKEIQISYVWHNAICDH